MPDTPTFEFGDYAIIFPPEPFQFGTSHVKVLPVPTSIPRPQYVIERQRRIDAGETDAEITGAGDLDPYNGDGRIELGGEEEENLRRTARLARKVREFAGGLVKVCCVLCRPVTHFHF
jgi:methionyl aminopeptidase